MRKLIITITILYFTSTNLMAQTPHCRPLSELINTKESAWTDFLQKWIKEATNKIEILPKDKARADSALYNSQVTTRSPMGAIVYETGGILVDNGWIRILGSGSKKLDRDLMGWNKGKTFTKFGEQLSYLLIADDVIGGFYAINAGGLSTTDIGKVFYFAPDDLLWTSTNLTYTQFIYFCFSGDIKKYYETFYWTGWEKDISLIDGTQGISCYPFLCTLEGKDINKVSRKPVPLQELWLLHNDLRKKFVLGEK
jgi:hypothetical protein